MMSIRLKRYKLSFKKGSSNMEIDIYQIDAFTNQLFGGNPAAVCPLENWLDDHLLLKIAQENNLAETAYFTPIRDHLFHLRWFTPEIEMDLCGHATLATAHVIFHVLNSHYDEIQFKTLSGLLTVKRKDGQIELDFPSRPPKRDVLPKIIAESLNLRPLEVWKARDYLLVYDNQEQIENIQIDMSLINKINIDPGGIILTAPGSAKDVDFVSRFFTPQASIFEDPVTGSAHCTLVPFWFERMNKKTFKAQQLSPRGGELKCELEGNRVRIRGDSVLYLKGEIII